MKKLLISLVVGISCLFKGYNSCAAEITETKKVRAFASKISHNLSTLTLDNYKKISQTLKDVFSIAEDYSDNLMLTFAPPYDKIKIYPFAPSKDTQQEEKRELLALFLKQLEITEEFCLKMVETAYAGTQKFSVSDIHMGFVTGFLRACSKHNLLEYIKGHGITVSGDWTEKIQRVEKDFFLHAVLFKIVITTIISADVVTQKALEYRIKESIHVLDEKELQ